MGCCLKLQKRLKAVNCRTLARNTFPWLKWLQSYKLADFQYDLIAGLTVGLTLVPQCMAYAVMCNVRTEFGLYSSFVGQFVYVLLGASKDASVGPSAILSMIGGQFNSNNPLTKQGDNTYTCFMAFVTGIILMVIGLLKLGFIVNLFSIPVVSGFTAAAGFIVISGQLKSFFGVSDAPNDSPLVIVKQVKNIFDRYDEIRMMDVIFGVSSLAFLISVQYSPLIVEKIRAKCGKPNPNPSRAQAFAMEAYRLIVASRNVIVFFVGTGISYALYQQDNTLGTRLGLVGYIKPGFPIPQFPATQVLNTTYFPATEDDVLQLNSTGWQNDTYKTINGTTFVEKTIMLKTFRDMFNECSVGYVIMPLMAMLEIFAMEKALGRKNGYRTDPAHELFALGMANFIQSFFGAFPSTTTLSRCALNDQCKVRTQIGSIVSAAVVMIVIGALTNVFFYVPKACLAGIMIAAGYNLVDFSSVRSMWREYRPDVFIFFATFLLCFFYDIAYGILICLMLQMLTFLRPMAAMKVQVDVEVDGQTGERHTIVKLPYGMKYPCADKFIDRMAHIFSTGSKHVVLDCHFITGIDYSGIQALRALLNMAQKKDVHIIFTNLTTQVHEKLQTISLEGFNYAENVTDAVKDYKACGGEVRQPEYIPPVSLRRASIIGHNPPKDQQLLKRRVSAPPDNSQYVGDLGSASISKVWAVPQATDQSDVVVDPRKARKLSRQLEKSLMGSIKDADEEDEQESVSEEATKFISQPLDAKNNECSSLNLAAAYESDEQGSPDVVSIPMTDIQPSKEA